MAEQIGITTGVDQRGWARTLAERRILTPAIVEKLSDGSFPTQALTVKHARCG